MAHLQVTIEVDPSRATAPSDAALDGVHVRGTVRHEDGVESVFVGWLSLMSVLQAAVEHSDLAPPTVEHP